ncbi:neuraminidase-like domain-containing protein [Polyangium aurulentum]|uniref:Tc toxin subunit A-related protein n=1 Tax=Polyangium aurulentum TaxID=2567896 RepID=UPI0010AE21AB|nr:neuraminidase-like domain-containing protein [Polyangium aurulentum]UQA60397.1 hypothetical protein E8A73_007960 [Polyangium aurulentum]
MDEEIDLENTTVTAYRLEGHIFDVATGYGVNGVRVEAWDQEGLVRDLVAYSRTDELGDFTISLEGSYLEKIFLDRSPILIFRLFNGDDEEISPTAITWQPSQQPKRIRIGVDMVTVTGGRTPASSVVQGRLTKADGSTLPSYNDYKIQVYDKDLSQGINDGYVYTFLGESAIDALGRYRVLYTSAALGRSGKLHPDLVVRALNPNGDTIDKSDEICQAPAIVLINLADGSHRGRSECDRVKQNVLSVIGTRPASSVDDDMVSYIACTTREDRNLVDLFVKAKDLEQQLGIDPVVFYGLLRQGLPHTRRELLSQRPATLRRALERSMAENIIGTATTAELDGVIAQFVDKMVTIALEPPEAGGRLVGVLTTAISPADHEEFVKAVLAHEGTVDEFWTDLSQRTAFQAPGTIERLKRTMQWGALSRYHAPLVEKLEELHTLGSLTSLRALAKYDETDWRALLDQQLGVEDIGSPSDIPGATENERRTNYARILERTVETAFPTAVIADRIARDEGTQADISVFFSNNPSLEFGKTRVSSYLEQNSGAMTGVVDVAATKQRLKSMERIFRVTRRYGEMKPLLSAGLHSARSIHRMGKHAFVNKFGPLLGGEDKAAQIFARAGWVTSAATALFGKYGSGVNGVSMFALPDLSKSAEQPHPDVADWAALFGTLDGCACEHCRSVHGPAAYLVDLLEFLDRHDSKEAKPNNGGFYSARDILIGDLSGQSGGPKGRRADVARILLSCENTNTTLPYIDLVNEILEVSVANAVTEPDLVWQDPIESKGMPQELLAMPEVVHPAAHQAAYTALITAVHPFGLPFHLWAEEARVYLEHLGVPRYQLLETFLAPMKSPPPDLGLEDQIARERLGLSQRAWDILTESTPSLDANQYWGMPQTNWVANIAAVPRFLKQSGLSFEELRELLDTAYVNGVDGQGVGGPEIKLNPVDGCDIDAKTLTNLSEAALARMNRFLRLRKRLDLRIAELDWMTTAFGVTNIDAEFLRKVADVLALQKELAIPLPVLLSFWGPIGTHAPEGSESLYAQLFLNRSVTTQSDQFVNVPTGTATGTILEHAAGVLAGLRIGAADLALLAVPEVALQQTGLPSALPAGAPLTLDNLSRLHRIVVLARELRLGIRDLCILLSLSGLDALTVDAQDPAKPATTRAFVELVAKVRQSGFSVVEMQHLTRHFAPPGLSVGPSDMDVARLVDDIEAAVAKIVADTSFSPDPEGQQTRSRLEALLSGDDSIARAANAEAVMAVLEGRSALATGAQRGLIGEQLAPFFGQDLEEAKDKLVGPVDPQEPSGFGAPGISDKSGRFEYVLVYLLNHLRKTQTESIVKHALATGTQLEADVTDHLLTKTLKSKFTGAVPAMTDFLPETNAVPGTNPPEAAGREDREGTVRLLHKVALITRRLKLDASQLAWLYPSGAETSWLDLNGLPLVQDDNASAYRPRFSALLRLVDFAALRDTLPGGREDLLAIFGVVEEVIAGQKTADDFYDEVTQRAAWTRDDLVYLVEAVFKYNVAPAPSDFLDEKALLCLHRAFQVLRRLGASSARALAWAQASLPPTQAPEDLEQAANIALEIKRVVRAKHDEAQWVEVARPLRDALREKQRDALVGFLVSAADLAGPDELFARLLVDVEMSPCQLTSRIKQAIGSVQTFAQRAFLRLESEVELGEDAAREWAWLKSYRVWEANRKVFLYPENWIEPELRDDKTPFFKVLESSLLQGEITADAAESAYLEYLEKLHEVGRLDVAAMCHEREDDGEGKGVDIVHVIARTPSAPHRYYYRRRVDSSYWTPWEKVDLDIQGDHLLATTWNRRLYLFWPVFEERAHIENQDEGTPQKRWRISFAWSEYRNGSFGPAQTTANNGLLLHLDIDPRWISFMFEREGDDLRIRYLVSSYGLAQNESPTPIWYAKGGSFSLGPCLGEASYSRSVIFLPFSGVKKDILGWGPEFSTPVRMNFMELSGSDKPDEFRLRVPLLGGSSLVGSATLALLEKTPGLFSVLVDRADKYIRLDGELHEALFYKDNARTFFVDMQSRRTPVWRDPAQAYPNAPAPVRTEAAEDIDPAALAWANEPKLTIGGDYTVERLYRFHTFYHPYVCAFTRHVARDGIDGLLRWSNQAPTPVQLASQEIEDEYEPTPRVAMPFPIEDVDFSFGGAYSQYNWELFFHAPLLVATRLSQNGRYEEAQRWFHYIFDPMSGSPDPSPQRFWNVRPFRENFNLASIQEELEQLAQENPNAELLASLFGASFDSPGTQDLAAQIARWRENPFNPHLIARMRPLAYQKTVIMKYVDNLIAWGDSLFRRDTIESINEATQIYILASKILGQRPRLVKEKATALKTYAQLEPLLDAFSNALVEIESIVPEQPQSYAEESFKAEPPPAFQALYFCVPQNEKMLALWDTVADRLFKIRCCMNINGVVRQLPLFEPPIDPALLVKAAAAGLDIGSLLADANAPQPTYRFSVLLPKAVELAGSVISMGAALLAALEKRDGEKLSLLRSKHEINVLTAVREVRKRQIDEAKESLEALRHSRKVIEERWMFYRDIPKEIGNEKAQRDLTIAAKWTRVGAEATQLLASAMALVPQFHIGMTGPLPTLKTETGGRSIGAAVGAIGEAASAVASYLSTEAELAGTAASHERRWAEWKLQERMAEKELLQIDRQILAAEIRLDIAQKELANHDLQIKNAKEVEEYLRDKYTNEELYDWMITQISGVYFQGYKLAYDLAKRAERAFQFELAQPDTSFVTFGYWDSLKKGLLAGEKLQHDLRRMEVAYLEQNKREYEITKHVSLAEIDPLALLELREKGSCEVELPEWLFDRDWPGHYMRRIKSVSLTVPVVNGPYAGVNCKLTLLKSSVRKTSKLASNNKVGDYPRKNTAGEDRFLDHYGAIQSIVTSSGQSDAGLFELVFRDERYLPFEGAGTDSTWKINLDRQTNQFDPTAVHDVVLHVRYTAREGGEVLKAGAIGAVAADPDGATGHRLFSAKTDFPDAWHIFTMGEDSPNEQTLTLPLVAKLFQPLLGSRDLEITKVHFFAKWMDEPQAPGLKVYVQSPLSGSETDILLKTSTYGTLINKTISTVLPIKADMANASWHVKVKTGDNGLTVGAPVLTEDGKLKPDALEDIWIVCEYRKQ